MSLTNMSEVHVLGLKTACRKLMCKSVQQERAKQFLDQEHDRDVRDAIALATMHVKEDDQRALMDKFTSWKIRPHRFVQENATPHNCWNAGS